MKHHACLILSLTLSLFSFTALSQEMPPTVKLEASPLEDRLAGDGVSDVSRAEVADDLESDAKSDDVLEENADGTNGVESDTNGVNVETPEVVAEVLPDHVRKVAPWDENRTMQATLHTSHGDIRCELFAGTHPLTVLNFKALALGKPAWTDALGTAHTTPYYQELSFGVRVKGRYVTVSQRPEGTGFVIADERCRSHCPVAGSIAMVQTYPGQSAAQFMLLASDIPVFQGMYTVFGQCGPIETIQKLTTEDAILHRVTVDPSK